MLRVRANRITWDEYDTPKIAQVTGSYGLETGWAPLIPSIIKGAKRKGVKLSPHAQRILRQHARAVREARQLAKLEDVPPTCAVERRAFAHQRVALAFFKAMQRHGYESFGLFDSPGVGKTFAAMLYAVQRMRTESPRVLIVCPNTAKRQWRREVRRYLGHDVPTTIVAGTIAEQVRRAQRDGLVFAHWESLVHARKGLLAKAWDVVVLDEGQAIGNRDAQRTETAHKLKARYRIVLTGHPYANAEVELFPLLKFLYPERYASYWRFFGMHIAAVPKPFGGHTIMGARQAKLLKWELAPFVLRRTKQQVFKNLPPVTRVPRVVELSAKGRAEYERLRRQVFVELDAMDGGTKVLPIINDLSRITRLRQYLVDPALIGAREPSVKFIEVLALLGELDAPIILFTSFAEAGVNLVKFLCKHRKRTDLLYRKVKPRDRERMQREFLTGKFDALVIQSQLGGTALNLGKYGYVGHLDLPWSARDVEQTEARVDRPEEGTGKLVPTTSYRIVVADSYEDRLQRRLESKHERFGKVFTVGQLKRLFAE